jgi:hypothetical protein
LEEWFDHFVEVLQKAREELFEGWPPVVFAAVRTLDALAKLLLPLADRAAVPTQKGLPGTLPTATEKPDDPRHEAPARRPLQVLRAALDDLDQFWRQLHAATPTPSDRLGPRNGMPINLQLP